MNEIKKQFVLFGIMFLIGIAILSLLSFTNDGIKEYNERVSPKLASITEQQLQWNNVVLIDSTIFNKTTNTCTASRYGMEITIYPCIAQDIDGKNIQQDVKFKWTGASQKNISWIFVYDNDLQSGKINAYINKTKTKSVVMNTWVNNYLVDKVQSYVNLTYKPLGCNLGNLNNTQFYNVTRTTTNATTYVQTICFSSISVVNATAFRISGNADLAQDIQYSEKDWVDVTSSIQSLGKGLLNDSRSYYKVEDTTFNPNQELNTQWIYTPKDSTKQGKWHILGYDSQTGLVTSVVNNQYIYVDPWWNSTWSKKREINITERSGNNLLNYTINFTVTYSASMQTDFDDLRFTDSTESVELPYWIESKVDSTSAMVFVRVADRTLTANQNTTIYMYYGNPSAASAMNKNTTFLFADDFGGGTLDSNKWQSYGQLAGDISYLGNNQLTLYRSAPGSTASSTLLVISKQAIPNPFIITANVIEYNCYYSIDLLFGAGSSQTVSNYAYPNWDTYMTEYEYGCWGALPNGTATEYARKTGTTNAPASASTQFTGKTMKFAYAQYNDTNVSVYMNSTFKASVQKTGSGFTYPAVAVIGGGAAASMGNFTISDFRVQTYAWKEPLITISGEQSSASVPTITWRNQTPADITATNIANTTVSIVYNITSDSGIIDTNAVNLFWLTNSTNNPDFTWYINGSIITRGFRKDGVIKSNNSNTWTFVLGDNIYPATYLLNISIFDNSASNYFNLTNDNALMKTIVLNMTNNTKYNFLEFATYNLSATVASLRVYYCNSTYTSGNIGTSTNCGLVADVPATQGYNHIENQTQHWLTSLAINTTTGTLGGVVVTNPAYFVWRGRTTGWGMRYVSTIARAGATQVSGNTGVGWANTDPSNFASGGTQDTHIHQFGDDSALNYYVCGNTTTNGIYNCSTTIRDTLNQSALPPSPPIVFNPTSTANYTYSVPINYTAALSPVGNAIVRYNISLYNADDTFNQSITSDNGVQLNYTWTNSNITYGTFNIHVYAIDSAGLYAFGESADFNLSATFNTTTSVSVAPASPIDYGSASTWNCANSHSLYTEMWVNGVNKTSEKGSSIIRAAGTYTINCSAETAGGYVGSSAVSTYVINKATTALTISAAPAATVSYGTQTTVTGADCPSQLTCRLDVNAGPPIINPAVATLNAGTYLYNYSTDGNENYTADSETVLVTVNKINPSLTITITPGTTVVNGTQTTATAAGCPGSCVFKRDASTISSPDVQTLGVGTYLYNYSFSGSTNYNAYSVSELLIVNPVTFGGTNGTINFTASNLSSTINFQIPYRFTTQAYMNLSSLVSCYQETANISTSCGGLSTGTYYGTSSSSLYDGDYSTSAESVGYFVNYSIPYNIYSATLRAKTQAKSTVTDATYSIPNECISNKINLAISSSYEIIDGKYYGKMQCLNSSAGYSVIFYSGIIEDIPSPSFTLFEEGITWSLLNNATNLNISNDNRQIYFYPGIFNQTNNKTSNFYAQINPYLESCTFIDGFCIIPIMFNSSSPGAISYSNVLFSNEGFIEGTSSYNANSIETKSETFVFNISYDNFVYDASATLVYNGTEYAATLTNFTTYNATISRTIQVPTGVGNKSFYWRIALTNATGTFYYNSSFKNQTIALLNMSICNSPYPTQFLGFTFHNETLASESVNATFSGTFYYWLSTNQSVNKTFSYVSATERGSYNFCFTPNTTIYSTVSATYDNSYSQQRSFENNSMTLINTAPITKDLLLLPDSNGIYISFIVQNQYQQRISNALIDIKKTAGLVPVEQKYTDGTGIAAFWLSTGTAYTITITANGYETYSTGITPSTSPVTITLTSTGGGGNTYNPNEDINIKILPTGSILENGTSYTFSFDIETFDTDLDGYGFSLWNKTSLLSVYKTGNDPQGETLTLPYNTGTEEYIIMRYYYIIDGDYTNGTRTWVVENPDGTDFSIGHAIGRFNNYTANGSTGLFGIKRGTTSGDFTFAIIIFLIIFVSAGVMTYKYGITSTTATIFLIFSIVYFLDVGAGLLDGLSPVGSIPHFFTLLLGTVLIGAFVKEVIA